jgi:gliding motility-associated-like protein
MKHLLIAAVAAMLLTSCNKNTDDKPACLLGNSYNYSIYLGSGSVIMPNAFTPNGDGKNDRFKPIFVNMYGTFTFKVFDKNNTVLFQTSDTSSAGWDGKNSAGEAMPPGRYAVKLATSDGYQPQIDFCVALLKYGSSNCIPQSDDGSYYFQDMYNPNIQSFSQATRETVCPR